MPPSFLFYILTSILYKITFLIFIAGLPDCQDLGGGLTAFAGMHLTILGFGSLGQAKEQFEIRKSRIIN